MELQYFQEPGAPSEVPPLAVRAGDFVFFAGGIAAHPINGVPDEVKLSKELPYHGSVIDRQLRYIYNNMKMVLEASGSSIRQCMKINSYHTLPTEIDAALRVRKDYFGTETPPPSTLVLVPETEVNGTSVTNDVVALVSDAKLSREGPPPQKSPLASLDLVSMIYGHPIFVRAVRGGGFIFTQGKTGARKGVGLDKNVLLNSDYRYRNNKIKSQTEFILGYLKSVLMEMGASLEHVVKADVHMSNMEDILGMDTVWRSFFPTNPPARTILPSALVGTDTRIEIELVAIDPKGPYRKETISTANAPQSTLHEAQAVKAGPFLFISGQLATDYKNGVSPDASLNDSFPFFSSNIKCQVEYILKNVEAICHAAGTSSKNLVRRRSMHLNMNELAEAEEVWRDKLGRRLPPTTTFRTHGPLPVPACTVGYELIAYCSDK